MHAGAADRHRRLAPSPATASAVADFLVHEFERDMPRVSMPRPESRLVVRIGPSARSGLDVYAFGAQQSTRRKFIRGGQRTLMARFRLGAHEAVFGVRASEIAARVVPLEELWGEGATRRLVEQLAGARHTMDAVAILESAIASRLSTARGRGAAAQLALAAAHRLTSASVNAVAEELGVSERHLRRVFGETVGVNPKTFAKLERFHRALRAASENRPVNWASIAAAVGYYDQAHLIAEFRLIAGVTPQALLGELRAASFAG